MNNLEEIKEIFKRGEYKEALIQFFKNGYIYQSALCFAGLKDYDSAIKLFKYCIKKDKNIFNSCKNLIQCYKAKEDGENEENITKYSFYFSYLKKEYPFSISEDEVTEILKNVPKLVLNDENSYELAIEKAKKEIDNSIIGYMEIENKLIKKPLSNTPILSENSFAAKMRGFKKEFKTVIEKNKNGITVRRFIFDENGFGHSFNLEKMEFGDSIIIEKAKEKELENVLSKYNVNIFFER